MVKIGAIRSKLPIKIAAHAITIVANNALTGSPLESNELNTFSGGISSSFVIACKRRGALVSDCNAAPKVDNKEPMTIR